MNHEPSKNGPAPPDRRKVLPAGLGLGAASLLTGMPAGAQAQQAGQSVGGRGATGPNRPQEATPKERRELGSLEVSALGFGCMNALQVQLTAADIKEIEDGIARIRVQGARLNEALLAEIDIGAKLGTSSRGGHGASPLPRNAKQ